MAERQAGHFRRVATTAEHRSGSRTPADDAFLLLFAHNPLPMWVFDDETLMFLEVNNAAVEHYGYSRDEFLTMRITDIRLPEDSEDWRPIARHPVPNCGTPASGGTAARTERSSMSRSIPMHCSSP